MTKREFVARLAQEGGMDQNYAEKILTAVLDSIEDALFRDGKITFNNFGVFEVRKQPEHKARNPATGEEIIVPPTKVVRFRPSSSLRMLLG